MMDVEMQDVTDVPVDPSSKVEKKNPNLEIAQILFLLQSNDPPSGENKDKLLKLIEKDEMAPFYKYACEQLGWSIDHEFVDILENKNETTVKKLDADIKDAEENLGESEIREAWLKKSEYLCRIGNKTDCLSTFRKTYEKTVGIGHQLDVVFSQIRVGLLFMDHQVITTNMSKAKSLMEQGGDWDRKNRMKAYEGLYAISIRDFKTAGGLFLDCVSTFTSYELMSYEKLIFYTVVASMLSLERSQLREKVTRGAEIQEQLHAMPQLKSYLNSLYDCDYASFFKHLAWIETEMKSDRYLAPHYSYYCRAMRVLAYKQLLSSYRSLTLDSMATEFGVSADFIDEELHKLISSGALHCKIDKVRGVVETNRLDAKNWQYQSVIKHGDILLNRVQKLSRVINV